jgi:heme exporter protein C
MLAIFLINLSIILGFIGEVPSLPILNETIRNLYFHVPMWFAMFFMYFISVLYSIKYLRSNNKKYDVIAVESVNVGILFCLLGFITGMI